MSQYEEFIRLRTYAKWNAEASRRETWDETVDRYESFFTPKVPEALHAQYKKAIRQIRLKKVMPSMRALWSSGEALENHNVAGYNCAYTPIEHSKRLSEILYILLCGAGCGFSVERQYINQLPEIPTLQAASDKRFIKVADSKEGWAEAYAFLIKALYKGIVPAWDLSGIRAEGSLLKTFGGRASGPEPLDRLFKYTVDLFKQAAGRKLNSLEIHDLVCYIASIVMCGGVRRSATISLSNRTDTRLRDAKKGDYHEFYPNRVYANNSIAYTERPDLTDFMDEWLALIRSGSGERGIFNRIASEQVAGRNGRREVHEDFGTNPCSEIILRPQQFCNLTEVVIRESDSLTDLTEKVKFATILGVIQSTMTDFQFLSKEWKENCDEERLLGVSLTGIMDHPVLNKTNDSAREWLRAMKDTAIKVAKKWSTKLEIAMPAAITCVKPSGTVSQLVNSSSGIHPRHSEYYVRRVRIARTDPLCSFLKEKTTIPCHPENGTVEATATTFVFEFPIQAPKDAVLKENFSAMQSLEHWLMLQDAWCEHKPSVTISVRDDEWMDVGAWVYKNFSNLSGVSFLPYHGGNYSLMPLEEINQREYLSRLQAIGDFNFNELASYEASDNTEGSREYACTGGSCEL
jgi:ribonucleoside-diphosphate reductase alpha chain